MHANAFEAQLDKLSGDDVLLPPNIAYLTWWGGMVLLTLGCFSPLC